jgi:very-short-patch-repair endonuclease
MILINETENKNNKTFKDIRKFSKEIYIVKCDYCGTIYEVKAVNYNSSKKNNVNKKDCCSKKECISSKKKETFIAKYGVDNPTKNDTIRNKVKKTNIERYGTETPFQSEQCKEKSKNTCLEKYGVDNVSKLKSTKEKSKNTCLEKYGVEYASQSDGFKENVKNTCLEKYGHTHPMMNSEIKNKSHKKLNDLYGGILFGSEYIKQKIENTCLEKYGVSKFIFTDEYKERIKIKSYEKLYNSLFDNRLNNECIPVFPFEEYSGVDKEYKFKCNSCDEIFKSNLDDGKIPMCPICNPKLCGSEQELKMLEYLKSINSEMIIVRNERTVCNGYELDFYLPEYKIAIELNGNYWHSELNGKDKNYHLNKTDDCESKGIKLIHIFEDEWLYKKNIIKHRLNHLFHESKRIYARNCIIKEISNKYKNKFLDEHHLQGIDNSKIKFGAFHEDELVAVMTFSKCRFVSDGSMEIIRFCSKYNVVGIGSKFISHFVKRYDPMKLITYADKRFGNGESYLKMGFSRVSTTPPSYFYMNRKSYLNRFNRMKFQKHKLPKIFNIFDDKLSEWQNMQLNGYDRIWDCGSVKYEMILKNSE